ncbi:FAD-binding oxidoreductase [Halomarina pelagica]|uniref:FAD-binding oxidoreductase n=1 Tax=Halomarina pelagica TaxID=2961599 RepID=UPI0020C23A5E|nr:FAD-binding oxidoreductase [Halomarina sp. BND7]
MSETETGYDCRFLADVVDEGRVSFEESRREQYAVDAGPHDPRTPDAVVWPADAAEVSRVLAAANERGVPVTPWSGGSSLEGNPIPVEGGVVLDVYGMDEVSVRAEDLQVVVGPGVVYDDLNETLAREGLRFPPGISSGDVATIGGMIANNASGFNAVRYGETRDHVRRLEVVLPDGRIVECGRDVVKTSAGYSLKDLFVGSEGTLGVVTEATLAVEGIPEHRRAALVTFSTERDASSAVSEVIRFGVRPGAIEYLSAPTVGILDEYDPDLGLEVAPTLIVELHANNRGIDEDVAFVRDICEDNGATGWNAAAGDEMDEVWRARREAYTAIRTHREGLEPVLVGDVVVPISRYPDVVEAVAEASADLDLLCPAVGHAGDGNLHYTPIVDRDDEDEVSRAFELNDRIVTRAIEMGGTATGEHGVGIGKRKFMEREHGAALELMRDIKEIVDPNGIMNPGKVIPDATE